MVRFQVSSPLSLDLDHSSSSEMIGDMQLVVLAPLTVVLFPSMIGHFHCV